MTRKQIGTITGLFLLWRAGLFTLSVLADRLLAYAPSFPYATTLLPSFGLPRAIYSFANFDGVHYLTIAREGYLTTNFIQAFFPLFPAVILHGLHTLFPSLNLLIAGLVLANLFFLGFLLIGFRLIASTYSARIAWRFIFAVLLFPWSIFLASLYTESLFLLLMISCFWFAHKKNWVWAALMAALLSSTRIVGIMIVPALLIELYSSVIPAKAGAVPFGQIQSKKYYKEIITILLGSTGLLAYMGYLYLHFGDPLYFLHVQAAFGAGRSNGITLYPQVVYRGLKILLTTTKDLKYITYLAEFLAGTLGMLAIVWPWKKISPGITFFALTSAIIPTVSGSFLSMGRFLLPCLPIYLLIAFWASRHPRLGLVWYLVSAGLCALNALLFLQGYWVA